jgi:hypothetical protein
MFNAGQGPLGAEYTLCRGHDLSRRLPARTHGGILTHAGVIPLVFVAEVVPRSGALEPVPRRLRGDQDARRSASGGLRSVHRPYPVAHIPHGGEATLLRGGDARRPASPRRFRGTPAAATRDCLQRRRRRELVVRDFDPGERELPDGFQPLRPSGAVARTAPPLERRNHPQRSRKRSKRLAGSGERAA